MISFLYEPRPKLQMGHTYVFPTPPFVRPRVCCTSSNKTMFHNSLVSDAEQIEIRVNYVLLSLLSFVLGLIFSLQPQGGGDNSPCETTSTMHTSPSKPLATPLMAPSTDQTTREQSGCSDQKNR
jgi:hypothetical protein